jgi:TRAP-type C4-dicarboxylate transport system permease small subunit
MLEKVCEILYRISKVFTIIALAIIVILVFAQVISRYIFTFSISWSQEVVTYLFIWMIFIGCSMGLRKGEIISIDFFIKKLSKKTALYINILNNSLLILFFTVGILSNNQIIKYSLSQLSPILNLSMGWIAFSFSVSAIIMILYLISNICEILGKILRERG